MKKSGSLKMFLLYIKIGETNYYQKKKETILNRAKDYYKQQRSIR